MDAKATEFRRWRFAPRTGQSPAEYAQAIDPPVVHRSDTDTKVGIACLIGFVIFAILYKAGLIT